MQDKQDSSAHCKSPDVYVDYNWHVLVLCVCMLRLVLCGLTSDPCYVETDQSDVGSVERGLRSGVIPNWSPPEEREAKFTDYSISSSVVPRNKGGGKKCCMM